MVLAIAGLMVTGLVSSAGALESCTYSSATKRVEVSLSANDDDAILYRSGNAIRMDAANCGAATVRNTNLIVVTGASDTQSLEVSLSGGRLGPGFSRAGEAPGSVAEIEIQVNLGAGTDRLRVEGGSGADKIRFGSAGVNLNDDDDRDITTMTGVNQFTGSGQGGNDLLVATGGKGTGSTASYPVDLAGLEGSDTLKGGNADDDLSGGPGPDSVSAGASGDLVQGGSGNDVLKGGVGSDSFHPESGRDKVFGELGNDTMSQEATADGPDTFAGGRGVDLYFAHRSGGQNVDLNGVADDGLPGERNNIKPDVEEVTTGDGDDIIILSGAANRVEANGGHDTVKGLGGRDEVIGGSGDDLLLGGEGNDELAGDADQDTVHGNGDEDEIRGGSGTDRLYGDADDDRFEQSSGPDGADKIRGGSGLDWLRYSERTAAVTITIGDGDADDGQAGELDEVFGDIERISTGSGSDMVSAPYSLEKNHILSGGGGTDQLWGGDGRDFLSGGPGVDTLYPEEGEDSVSGDEDGDTIQAVDGSVDSVDGGPGTDTCNTDPIDTVSDCP